MCAKSEPPHPSARVSRGCRSHDTSMSIQVIELSVQAEQGCYTNPIGRELEEGVITTESEKNPRKLVFEMTQEQTKYCFGVEKKDVEDEITVIKNEQDDCMHSRSAKLSATSAGADEEGERAATSVICQRKSETASGSAENVIDNTSPPPRLQAKPSTKQRES